MGRSLSKSVRFEVFKRDGFVCQYCGNHPPKVVLEVDHIIAVANGGDNDITNLVTACFDCNRGKSARPLSAIPQSLESKAAEIAEREEQLRGYGEIAAARRERLEDQTWQVFNHWRGQRKTTHQKFNSVKRFVDQLGVDEVLEAVEIAMGAHLGDNSEFRYFCGVCWNKIKGDGR